MPAGNSFLPGGTMQCLLLLVNCTTQFLQWCTSVRISCRLRPMRSIEPTADAVELMRRGDPRRRVKMNRASRSDDCVGSSAGVQRIRQQHIALGFALARIGESTFGIREQHTLSV